MTPKIYYDHGSRVLIGPLGFWEAGDEVELPDGRTVHVGSVDLDGMAIAWTTEVLAASGRPVAEALKDKAHIVSANGATLTPAQRAQCEAIAAAGRRLRDGARA